MTEDLYIGPGLPCTSERYKRSYLAATKLASPRYVAATVGCWLPAGRARSPPFSSIFCHEVSNALLSLTRSKKSFTYFACSGLLGFLVTRRFLPPCGELGPGSGSGGGGVVVVGQGANDG